MATKRKINTEESVRLLKELRKSFSNMEEIVTSFSSRINLHDVITQSMIEDTKKIVQDYKKNPSIKENKKKLEEQHEDLMYEMCSLFYEQPQLKEICEQIDNQLVLSCFTKYEFKALSSRDDDDKRLNDIKLILNCCGHTLTYLNVGNYSFSQIMPLITMNCSGLEELFVKFKETNDQDFENAFFNMRKLEKLTIIWDCENSTLPMTLVNSLGQVGGTLKKLYLACRSKDGILLPDSLALIFPRLKSLERLCVNGFRMSQKLVQSIGETKNLINLEIVPLYDCPMINEKINMFPIGNLKNLETLSISWNWIGTDEFLINLCNNSKKLQSLRIIGTNITDDGIKALNNLSQLQWFNLGLDMPGLNTSEKKNKYITDESIQCLFNENLEDLDLSNCTKISNKSVIKIFENLPNLSFLTIENTNVTIKVIEELSKLTKSHKEKLRVFVSFEDSKNIFKSLVESHNVEFELEAED